MTTTDPTRYAIVSTARKDSYHNADWQPIHDTRPEDLYGAGDDLQSCLRDFFADADLREEADRVMSAAPVGGLIEVGDWAYTWQEWPRQ